MERRIQYAVAKRPERKGKQAVRCRSLRAWNGGRVEAAVPVKIEPTHRKRVKNGSGG